MILLKGLKRFTINANKVKIDTKVESEDVLPNTKLSKATEDVEDEKIHVVSLISITRKIMILQK